MFRTRKGRSERRRGVLSAEARTAVLGVIALATVGAVAAAELGRIWRKRADQTEETLTPTDIIKTGREAVTETVAVAVEGYREITTRESAAFNLMSAFVISFGLVRLSTFAIRRGIPPFRNVSVSGRHIHHFVPGMLISFGSGTAALVIAKKEHMPKLAIPFGIGMGLVFDESAMLLELQDIYWTREGLLSVQITLATATLLAATAYAIKIILRGEQRVLDEELAPGSPKQPA